MSDPTDVIERVDLFGDAELPATREVAEFVKKRSLATPSARYSNFRAVFFLFAVVGLVFLGHDINNPILWVGIWIIEALLFIGTNSAVHEAVHGNLYRSKSANYVAGIGWGLVTMFNYAAYRGLHLQHHAHTHAMGDGEPVNRKLNRLDYVLYMLVSGWVFMFMLPGIGTAASCGAGPGFMAIGNRRKIARFNSVALLIAGALLAYGFVRAPLLTTEIWLAPTLLYYLVFAPMIALPEHQDCAWGPATVFTTTRITKSNPVMHFLAWGINFHAAHHLVPSVPGQKLEPLSDLIEPFCNQVESSYLKWHWSMLTGHGRPVPPPYPAEAPPEDDDGAKTASDVAQ
ncbi:MAG TPA: fatty acid desaturase [Acidimicrobiales bacterium]|nr:fatty acid desaturase [Acidimicrobiales bacterium]